MLSAVQITAARDAFALSGSDEDLRTLPATSEDERIFGVAAGGSVCGATSDRPPTARRRGGDRGRLTTRHDDGVAPWPTTAGTSSWSR